ncbi:MAG: ABC transporter permease [Gemmatimonadales bacterium]
MSDRHGGPLLQLTLCRTREFLREPEAIFWVFAFPVVLALGLGLAFKNRGPQVVRIAVESGPGGAALQSALDSAKGIEAELLDKAEAERRLKTGRIALVVEPGNPAVFRYDSTRSESYLSRLVVDNALQRSAGRQDVWEVRDVKVTEVGSRYIDFLIPGLIGMNIMGTGLWGVGFGIVRVRNRKLLKRLIASPMKRSQYLLSNVLARLVFLVLEVGAVLLFGHFVFGVPIRGSILSIGAIVLIGAMTFAGLGILVASRVRTIEGVSGLMNLIMVPMWIFSGIFFAHSNFPDAIQPFIVALPLTAFNDALRGVMIDGSSLAAMAGLLGIVAAWGIGSFGVAVKIFRWE